jgi:hypothetical protein
MKNIILTVLILCFNLNLKAASSTALSRSNGLLQFIAENAQLRNFALTSAIKTRCSRYVPRRDRSGCWQGVKKMLEILDYDLIFPEVTKSADSNIPDSFVFVAFKTDFINLLSDPKTTRYLSRLNQDLYKYLLDEIDQPNIWEITKRFYATDYLSAKAMAAFFQDTSLMKLHLGYLYLAKIEGNETFHENQELLSRVIDTINLVLDSSGDNFATLFYPKEFQNNLNRSIYHFYVPFYLAKSLERKGFSEQVSRTAPFMLTLTYEFITSAKDQRYIYQDPERIDNLHKLRDIYGGYCGANFATRGKTFNKSFEIVRENFSISTENSVKLLLEY